MSTIIMSNTTHNPSFYGNGNYGKSQSNLYVY